MDYDKFILTMLCQTIVDGATSRFKDDVKEKFGITLEGELKITDIDLDCVKKHKENIEKDNLYRELDFGGITISAEEDKNNKQ